MLTMRILYSLISSSAIRGSIFISINNFTAQKRVLFDNQSILNVRVLEVRDARVRSSL